MSRPRFCSCEYPVWFWKKGELLCYRCRLKNKENPVIISKENINEVLTIQPVEKGAKCALCEKPIDESEKFMLVLVLKVSLLKMKKPVHRLCGQQVLTGAQDIVNEADQKAKDAKV